MAFEVGKREKIFVGVVGLVFSIAVLHFMLFKPRHDKLNQAKADYEAAVESSKVGRVPKDWRAQVTKYNEETAKLTTQYRTVLANMRLITKDGQPYDPMLLKAASTFFADPKTYHPYPEEDQVAQLILTKVRALVDFAQKNPQTKFSYLLDPNSASSWKLPTALPEAFTRGQADLNDEVNKLIQSIRFIKSSQATDPNQLMQAQTNWWTHFTLITGADMTQMQAVINEGGPFAWTIKMLMTIDLIDRQMKAAGKPGVPQAKLREAFGVELNPLECIYVAQQLDALIDLQQIMQKTGIEEVLRVKLDSRMDKIFNPKFLETPPPVGATPTPTPTPSPTPSYTGGYGGYGAYGGAGGAAATPTPAAQENVGTVTPIEIQFVAPNPKVIDCLYAIASAPAYYPIDALTLRGSVPLSNGQLRGKVVADALVNVLADFPSK